VLKKKKKTRFRAGLAKMDAKLGMALFRAIYRFRQLREERFSELTRASPMFSLLCKVYSRVQADAALPAAVRAARQRQSLAVPSGGGGSIESSCDITAAGRPLETSPVETPGTTAAPAPGPAEEDTARIARLEAKIEEMARDQREILALLRAQQQLLLQKQQQEQVPITAAQDDEQP
jgi:hypothetical protein